MSDGPRYTALRDYVRVLGENRLLVFLTVLAAAGGAYAYSATREAVYTAESSISFRDPTEDLDLLGGAPAFRQTDDQRASIQASLARSTSVATRVKRALKSTLSIEDLQARISPNVESRTALVVLRASARDPVFSARLADEFARQTVEVATIRERKRLDRAVKELRRNAPRLRPGERAAGGGLLHNQRVAAVETLRDLARPADVARSASVPASPSSPRPLRNTLLGAVGGLVLGMIAAFVRDALDRRLKPTAQLEEQLQLSTLAHLREEALGTTSFSPDGSTQGESQLEAFRMLHSGLAFLEGGEGPPRAVLVTSPLPEEGKTTVAMGIAVAGAQAGRRTLLLDADLHRRTLAQRMGIAQAPGLADYLMGSAEFSEIVQELAVGEPAHEPAGERSSPITLSCVPAGSAVPSPAKLLAGGRLGDLVERLSGDFALVVLDTGPLLAVSDTREMLPLVDTVVFCVRAYQTSLEQAVAARSTLARFDARRVGLVVTGVRERDTDYYGYYGYGYGQEGRGRGSGQPTSRLSV